MPISRTPGSWDPGELARAFMKIGYCPICPKPVTNVVVRMDFYGNLALSFHHGPDEICCEMAGSMPQIYELADRCAANRARAFAEETPLEYFIRTHG